jgi:hypothetical protein
VDFFLQKIRGGTKNLRFDSKTMRFVGEENTVE